MPTRSRRSRRGRIGSECGGTRWARRISRSSASTAASSSPSSATRSDLLQLPASMNDGTPQAALRDSRDISADEIPVAHNNWDRYGLPADMTGKTFLDVGCWEGVNCAEAVRRGASQVVGVDLCTSDELRENVEKFGFEFVQMDILSEKWLE